MWQLISDPARTAFNIVTLPEDMSVNESIELHAAAQEKGLPPGKAIVNAVYPDFFPHRRAALRRAREQAAPASDLSGRVALAALDAAVSSSAHREADEEMLAKLSALPLDRIELPFLFGPRIGPEELETLADALDHF
jgi:hypothetical protein